MDAFAEALSALMQPVRFVCRGGAAHLKRVRDLHATLSVLASRLSGCCRTPKERALVGELVALLPCAEMPEADQLAALAAIQTVLQELARGEAASLGTAVRGAGQREAVSGAAARRAGEGDAEGAVDASRIPPARRRRIRAATPATDRTTVIAASRGIAAASAATAAAAHGGLDPSSSVQAIKGVGPALGALLAARGLHTIRDLLHFLPRRYVRREACVRFAELAAGQSVCVEGEIEAVSYRAFGGRRQLDVVLTDGTGMLYLTWFRVPGRSFVTRFSRGQRLCASGEVGEFRGRLQIVHPELGASAAASVRASPAGSPASPFGAAEAGDDTIIPVYPEVEGLAATRLRRLIAAALPACQALPEPLPQALRERRGLPALSEALTSLHKPPRRADPELLSRAATPWHERLVYEELLLLQLSVLKRRAAGARHHGVPVRFAEDLSSTAKRLFPFALTGAQARALGELGHDLQRDVPMQRLLQGDVGSGKTAVAFAAAAAVVAAGLQVAIMAPTEILAEQHARLAEATVARLGARVALLTGATPAAARTRLLGSLADGAPLVLIGTHALVQPDVRFGALALAIVDEQHRFGVMQRAALVGRERVARGRVPHLLVMTATPIPRTLALTAYGDLDISLVDELPPGRTPVRTQLVRAEARALLHARLREALTAGRQAYVVYPLIEGSEGEGMEGVRDATSAAAELSSGVLGSARIALLHGRLTPEQKEAVMAAFARHDADVLVATTVVEVGIDVPSATLMVIEHAERFGLSQLHQLRGRVGRGAHAGECLLVSGVGPQDPAWERLRVLEATNDGFRIAEADLAQRGPGDFMGTRQSGLATLALADLVRDEKLLVAAREDAAQLLACDPELGLAEHRGLAALLAAKAAPGVVAP